MSPVHRATAPGKLVLWGEYGVLAGAPAVAIAVDRTAVCTFTVESDSRTWTLTTPGLTEEPVHLSLDGLIISSPPPPDAPEALLWQAICTLKGAASQLPAGGMLELDSSAFAQGGVKLGLGSSAAVCTALVGLLQSLTDLPVRPEDAFQTHHRAQGGKGSGIDVAAALQGGMVLFRPNAAAPSEPTLNTYQWPEEWHWRALWTSQPAATTAHIQRFDQWFDASAGSTPPPALEYLCACAETLAAGFTPERFRCYIAALMDIDRRGRLGVYTQLHTKLHNLARGYQIHYKPCGAGGGDAGIAVSNDPARLQAFCDAAIRIAPTVHPLDLRLATDGIRIKP